MRQLMMSRRTATVSAVGALVLLATLAITAPATGSGPQGDSQVAESLRETERTRLQALVAADMPVVDSLHAQDFRLVPPPGFSLTRDEYLQAVESGELDYLAFEPVSDIEVDVYGQAAVIRYVSRIHVVAEGIGEFEHDTWHTYLYERRHGSWQVVWEQATAVGGFPPA